MGSSKNISQLIQEIARKGISANNSVIGVAKNVRASEGLCDVEPINEDGILKDVKLRTQQLKIGGGSPTDYLVIEPVADSQVIVSFLSTGQAFVSMYSEIETVNLIIGDISLFLDSNIIKLNGDNLEGLVKVVALTNRLNEIEDALNTLISDFNTHAHTGVTTGGGTSGTPATTTTADPGSTSQSDIENTTVKHGE